MLFELGEITILLNSCQSSVKAVDRIPDTGIGYEQTLSMY